MTEMKCYADDTQLFLSFHPSVFQANISHLQNALTQITSWMTSNLLYLDSSKTEFLLIGLKQKLSKIHNSSTSIDATQSARNLDIVHSKIDYCNSLYYGLPKYEINRLRRILNALARTVVQAPKFKHITPILKSLHWLKVSERIEYEIISLTNKILNTTQPSYLYDLVSTEPPSCHNRRSSPYVTLIKPSSSLIVIIDPSDMLHLISGTSFLHHSEFLIRITHSPLSDLHSNMPV